MLDMKQMSFLTKAAQSGAAINFDSWEKNQGVINLRKINKFKLDGKTHIPYGSEGPIKLDEAARRQMPYIKALWEQMSGGLIGIGIPKPMKQFMNGMFERIKHDREYARLVYNLFPLIADRYGVGTQANGKPRLSFVRMKDDPDCARLRQ